LNRKKKRKKRKRKRIKRKKKRRKRTVSLPEESWRILLLPWNTLRRKYRNYLI